MVAVEEDGDVDVHNVARPQWPGVRDAVADALVDGRAHGLGEAAIGEGGRVGARGDDAGVHRAVNLVRRHAGGHQAARERQHVGRQGPGSTHGVDAGGVVHLHAFGVSVGLGVDVGRARNVVGHRQAGGDGMGFEGGTLGAFPAE